MQGMFSRCRELFSWRCLSSWLLIMVAACLVSLTCLPRNAQGQYNPAAEDLSEPDKDIYADDTEQSSLGSRIVPALFVILLPVLGMAFIYLWISQLVQLMIFTDNDFPGRTDKILWLIIYIAFVPIAPFIFMWWKKAYLHVRHLEKNG